MDNPIVGMLTAFTETNAQEIYDCCDRPDTISELVYRFDTEKITNRTNLDKQKAERIESKLRECVGQPRINEHFVRMYVKAMVDFQTIDVDAELSVSSQGGDLKAWEKGRGGLLDPRTIAPIVHTLMELCPDLPAPDFGVNAERIVDFEDPDDIWSLFEPLEPLTSRGKSDEQSKQIELKFSSTDGNDQ